MPVLIIPTLFLHIYIVTLWTKVHKRLTDIPMKMRRGILSSLPPLKDNVVTWLSSQNCHREYHDHLLYIPQTFMELLVWGLTSSLRMLQQARQRESGYLSSTRGEKDNEQRTESIKQSSDSGKSQEETKMEWCHRANVGLHQIEGSGNVPLKVTYELRPESQVFRI